MSTVKCVILISQFIEFENVLFIYLVAGRYVTSYYIISTDFEVVYILNVDDNANDVDHKFIVLNCILVFIYFFAS